MKVTCIVGSARNNGSCAYLIDTLINGLKTISAQIVKYCIGDCMIGYCTGCKKCYTDGKCFQNDDVEKIVGDILSSDFVAIAAPSYWAYIPAQLKTFIDRNTPFGDTNPNRILVAERPIKGIAIAVRAGVRESENESILNAIEHYYGHLGIKTVKKISVCKTDTLDDLLKNHQDTIDEVYDFGKNLAYND